MTETEAEHGHAPPPGWYRVVTAQLNLIDGRLGLIEQVIHQLKEISMSTQDDVNAAAAAEQADAAALTQGFTDIATAVSVVQAEIANLAAQVAAGQPVDTSALVAADAALTNVFAGLPAAVASVVGLEPAPTPPAA